MTSHRFRRPSRRAVTAGVFAALLAGLASQSLAQRAPRAAPAPGITPCPIATGLPIIPEIASTGGHLRATIKVVDGVRTLWDSATPPGTPPANTRCGNVYLRYFTGHNGLNPNAPDIPAFAAGDVLPGPTLRAKVGDWIEIAFQNQVDPKHFGNSIDRGDTEPAGGHAMPGMPTPDPSAGCDVTTQSTSTTKSTRANGDTFPNCIHGSSTTNLHFHGTHTTPSTTGDNVLLFVRPALRKNDQLVQPYTTRVDNAIVDVLRQCESVGIPGRWRDMPKSYRDWQYAALRYYDKNTPFRGGPQTLPPAAQLWPVNQREIDSGLWPQYSIGGTPYCFHLPAYDPAKDNPPKMRTMGQAPGTHWYHAHKHGSTALNVANGMVGAFIITGKYDTDLHAFYDQPGWDFQEKVLVIQQLAAALRKTDPTAGGPGSPGVPVLSVNGRRSPVVTMRPNQVQLFRFVNGAERDGVLFQNFAVSTNGNSVSCSKPSTAPCVHWNQTAQDGVQFINQNYDPGDHGTGPNAKPYLGTLQDQPFYLAPANRADLLVQAPSAPGRYDLAVTGGVCSDPALSTCGTSQKEILLTVSVEGPKLDNPMPFVSYQRFPEFPKFLSDIPASDVLVRRSLTFQDVPGVGLQINGQQFNDNKINQSILLNAVEEWKIANLDNDKEHPFHIHINPFQIVEINQPNSPSCKGSMDDPASFDQCTVKLPQPWVWWDTFAIPAGKQADITAQCPKGTVASCPEKLQPYTQCRTRQGSTKCTESIPGWFKMRSRFVDFTGTYVLHCHILTHEDRGMMQLIEVVPDETLYTHH
jgi:FtsP/CotA-like multicopper oxidase with cupredoxin domain